MQPPSTSPLSTLRAANSVVVHGACNRGFAVPALPVAWAGSAAYDPAPESDSSHPRSAPGLSQFFVGCGNARFLTGAVEMGPRRARAVKTLKSALCFGQTELTPTIVHLGDKVFGIR
jgi:hypothetical protein